MPRPPRIRAAGVTLHIVQRGNDRNRTFFCDGDFHAYIDLLIRACRRYATRLHTYVLMTNHVHLLMTSSMEDGVSRTMQYVGSNYSRRINTRHERTGTLWEGRFKSSPIESEFYCLACYRYIELNPVRAGIVRLPQDYPWSSYRENVGLCAPSIVEPHDCFSALGRSASERIERYRELVKEQLPEGTLDTIRRAARQGRSLGRSKLDKAQQRKRRIRNAS